MREWLVEVMMEKIPQKAQAEVLLKQSAISVLKDYENTKNLSIYTCVSPYRLILVVKDMPSMIQRKSVEIKGPRVDVQEEIVKKFAEKHSVSINDLHKKIIGNIEFWHFNLVHPSIPAYMELGNIATSIFNNITWPEYMSWGVELKCIRPVRRIVSVFDESPLSFYWKEAELHSSPCSLYRLTSDEEFTFNSYKSYMKFLTERGIYIDRKEREKQILQQINNVIPKNHLLHTESKSLIEYICASTESPIIYASSYSEKFDLPDRIKVAVMAHHQQYIPLVNSENKLSNMFLLHTNYKLEDNGTRLKIDSERCLSARFKDAEYFWKKDILVQESDHFELMRKSMIQKDLGSLGQQTNRLEFMVSKFFDDVKHLKEAARYLNIDLFMNTVVEIPELHGVISGMYATLYCKADKDVAKIIEDSLHPKGDNDNLTSISTEGAYLGFCKRLDEIVGFFGIGQVPKGSSDPLGLRRSAFGLIKLGFHIGNMPKMNEMIKHLIGLYEDQGIRLNTDTQEVVSSFLKDRMTVILNDISEKFGRLFVGDTITWLERIKLNDFIKNGIDHYDYLHAFYKRLNGILNIESNNGQAKVNTSYNDLTEMISKPSNEVSFLLKVGKQTEMALDTMHISDLKTDAHKDVMNTLKIVKKLFDSYANFSLEIKK
jgi:glycyl-tRNA synthetase beta chain